MATVGVPGPETSPGTVSIRLELAEKTFCWLISRCLTADAAPRLERGNEHGGDTPDSIPRYAELEAQPPDRRDALDLPPES